MRAARRLAAIGALFALGCSNTMLWETGLPWTRADFRVERVDRRGPYLDVRVSSDPIERRFFTPADEACTSMLRPGEIVELRSSADYGPFRQGERECRVVGIGDLEKFRGSRSRGGFGEAPLQRGNDRIEIVHTDEEYLYARGGFSIAALLGWAPGTNQVIALLPRTPECAPLAEGGFVSVLFREFGSPALGIAAGDTVCPVRGVMATLDVPFEAAR